MTWYENGFNRALRDARVGEQLVLVALLPDWSDYARQVHEDRFADPRVVSSTGDLLCLKYTKDDANLRQVAELYNVENFPSLLFVDSKGRIEDLIEGYIPADALLEQLARISAGEGTVSDHQAQVDEAPEDLERQWALMDVLRNVRDWRRADKVKAQIQSADPEGQTPAGSRLVRQGIGSEIFAAVKSDGQALELEPVLVHVSSRTEPRMRFEGWNDVANTLAGQGDIGGARDAFRTAFVDADRATAGNWAMSVAGWMLHDEEHELMAADRAFVLELASLAEATLRRCLELAPESEDYRAMLDQVVAMR